MAHYIITLSYFCGAGGEQIAQALSERLEIPCYVPHVEARHIRQLAKRDSCILVGECANYLLRDRDNVLGVLIEAPQVTCVRNRFYWKGIKEPEAQELICKDNQHRTAYYQSYTRGGDWRSPSQYDLTINTEKISSADAVNMILASARVKLGDRVNVPNTGMSAKELELRRRMPNKAALLHCKWFY